MKEKTKFERIKSLFTEAYFVIAWVLKGSEKRYIKVLKSENERTDARKYYPCKFPAHSKNSHKGENVTFFVGYPQEIVIGQGAKLHETLPLNEIPEK